ncbi:hypothetical protein [Streptomyces sp. NPDC001594]|uniref:hypothetical protein n=1 Tax=Streptomyces sp. NPDC001594 TaxID=3364590 RepID=UPI00369C3533
MALRPVGAATEPLAPRGFAGTIPSDTPPASVSLDAFAAEVATIRGDVSKRIAAKP